MVKDAKFVSVWDGEIEIESSCKVDMETKEVFDIEVVDAEDFDIDICTGEYIILDGVKCRVYSVDTHYFTELSDDEYWHE